MVKLISYGADELQQIKLFKYDKDVSQAIVFVHGGGWRDPNNTYDDFSALIEYLEPLPVNLISINYRLSPKIAPGESADERPPFRHPLHLVDVVNAINFISTELAQTAIALVGHSVGASLCLQLLNYREIIETGLQRIGKTADFADIDNIVLDKVVFLDGIFDVRKMLQEYGDDYKPFVYSAFVDEDHYVQAFQTSGSISAPFSLVNDSTRLVLVHSLQDELLSTNQTHYLQELLDRRGVSYTLVEENWGEHEEIYTRKEVAQLIADLYN